MNLIKWKNSKIEIAPEAYAIKVFRDIWKKDRSKNKEKAILELGLLYFMYDPRSEYQFETNEKERLEVIKKQTGVPSSWKETPLFKQAKETYKYLTTTSSSEILKTNRITVETIRDVLNTPMEELELDDEKRIAYVEKMAKISMTLNKLAIEIAQAEKEIYKDVEEHSAQIRGKKTLSIGDWGLDNI